MQARFYQNPKMVNHGRLGKRQQGFYILATSVVLLISITILALLLAKNVMIGQRIANNEYYSAQAFEAAEAGIEYGFAYLQKNRGSIVVDTNLDGKIDNYNNATVKDFALPNQAKFSITYENPQTNNFKLINIIATGVSSDGRVTETVTQLVELQPLLSVLPNATLSVRLEADLGGNSTVTNLNPNPPNNFNVISGKATNVTGSAVTVTNQGVSSTKKGKKGDIKENQTAFSGVSGDQFFTNTFGMSKDQMRSISTVYYENSRNENYSDKLNGMKNRIIWIEQTAGTAKISGPISIGTEEEPVILIINGDVQITGQVKIYGMMYTLAGNNNDTAGKIELHGGVAAETNFTMRGSSQLTYDPDVLGRLQQFGMYAKVPGGWRDFSA